MKLADLAELAQKWCPLGARWEHLIELKTSWGPAHELGHALIEGRTRWDKPSYGRCAIGFCHCDTNGSCDTYEAAAMYVSRKLLTACKRPELADQEIDNTADYDLIEPVHFARAKTLLREKNLWPVPRSRNSLEAALRRRLGKPRGGKPKKQKRRPQTPSLALALLTAELLR